MKEKLLWISIFAIFISGIVNYQVYKSNQLDEPIFLEHYIAKDIYKENEMVTMTFYYLTNKENPMQVNYVVIDDVFGYTIDNYDGSWNEGQPMINFHQEFTYQYLVPTTIEIPAETIPLNEDKSWKFSTMEVYFSNDDRQTVDIGEVIISKDNHSKISGLKFSSGSGGSDGFGDTFFRSTMPHEVIGIDNPFEGKVEDQVAIKIDTSAKVAHNDASSVPGWLENGDFEKLDSKDGSLVTGSIEPIQIGQNGWVRIYTQARPNHSRMLEFPIEIRGITDSGDEFHTEAYVHEVGYLDEKQVREIISSKRAGGEK